eukprot:6664726-Prymnesium_polylepis.1
MGSSWNGLAGLGESCAGQPRWPGGRLVDQREDPRAGVSAMAARSGFGSRLGSARRRRFVSTRDARMRFCSCRPHRVRQPCLRGDCGN